MRFAQGYYAYCFWIVFALILFFIRAFRRKKTALRKFAEESLLNEIASSVNFKRQIMKFTIIVAALTFGVFSLMRPQWGFQWREMKRKGLDILIAIDTSKSMLAEDVKPNRLERAKLAVKDLVRKLKGDRIGLIAFSGTAFLQCPLTVDYNGFMLALNDLNTDVIPRGGTFISSAIKTAIKSYEGGGKKYKVLIIITDGEDHEGDPLRAVEAAKKEGIKIFCIGIGTTEGELIQVIDKQGRRKFLKDKQGNVVKSRLNEALLQKIALSTKGTYVRSRGARFGLNLIYEEKLLPMERKEIKAQMNKVYYERFQIPLVFTLLILLIEPFISDRKKTI